MNIEKSLWSSDEDSIHLSVPFTKVDREKRTVSGFATLDNVDQTDDVVTAEASDLAFKNFRGNIREMHEAIAVGKMLSFEPKVYYDTTTKEFYNGIYVTCYISKGAQDTWEKILDGTLSAFSIGGKILEIGKEIEKYSGKEIRLIKRYNLVELSIVDSPANQLCNIFSVEKMNGQMIFKGLASETVTENIFYCEESDNVFVSQDATFISPVSGRPAELIGWVERSDTNKAKEIEKILASFRKLRLTLPEIQKNITQVNAEGGNEVSDTQEETVVETAAVEEVAVVDEVKEITVDTSAESVEKATEVQEVQTEELDFSKMFGEFKSFLSETLEKAAATNASQVIEIKTTIESFTKSVDSQLQGFAEQHTILSKAVEDIKGSLETVEKRVEAVEGETAVKKSYDLGGLQETKTIKKSKSKWGGSILGSTSSVIG